MRQMDVSWLYCCTGHCADPTKSDLYEDYANPIKEPPTPPPSLSVYWMHQSQAFRLHAFTEVNAEDIPCDSLEG